MKYKERKKRMRLIGQDIEREGQRGTKREKGVSVGRHCEGEREREAIERVTERG